jgi:uncharacterized membrane protein
VIQKDSTYVPTCVKEDSGINVWWVYGLQILILILIIVFFGLVLSDYNRDRDEKKYERYKLILFWVILALIIINVILLLFKIQGSKIIDTDCKVSNKDCFDTLIEICINDSTTQPKNYAIWAIFVLIVLFIFALIIPLVDYLDKQKTSILKPGEPCMCAKEYSEAFKDYMCVPSSESN